MDTKKQNISAGKKGGRNPFGKLAFAVGGLTVGAGLAEAIGKWRTEHPHVPEEVKNEEIPEEPVATNEEQIAENIENIQEPQQPNEPNPNEPQPIDPEANRTPEETGEQANASESVDETAERIANSDEIDPADGKFDSFWKVGEHRTFYTETGEIDVFDIELNDPNLAGYPFMFADTDGDGFYDTILMADGTPANIQVSTDDGELVGLDSYLAQANMTRGDLEEMHDNSGGYLRPNEDIAQNDDPSGDMLDEKGQRVSDEQVAQKNTQPTSPAEPASDEEDEDEAAYLALLHQLLDEEDKDEEEEEGEVVESPESGDDDPGNDNNEFAMESEETDEEDMNDYES